MASKGVGPTDIATVVGMSRNTVRQYLQRVAPELEALRTFKDRLGDSLALSLAKCLNVEDRLLDALNDDTVLATSSTAEKERLLGRVTIAKGMAYDKSKLETGKSTSNNRHEIQLKQAHASLTFDDPLNTPGRETTD